jgi:restriction endonuclease S subunit
MRDGWLETTFRAFASLEKGISYKSSELCDEGEGMPFINLKSIDRGGGYRADGLKWYSGKFKSSQVVEPGDLILCCTDLTKQKAILGYPILVPAIGYSRFCISLDLAKILVDEKMILNSFLFLLLQDRRMREFMQSRSSGTTVMHLKTSEVPDVQVELPPLPEQKRIVDLISSVDSYIEALQQQLESAKRSRNAVLHELLTAGGDGWVEATLKDALEPIANRPDGKDYPLVLSVTEKRGIIPQTEIFKHRIATDDISKYKVLEPMDIAYNPYLLWCGAIGQWQGSEAGVVSPVYECFRVKSNFEPRYLGYIFETGILTNYFDALAIGSIVRRRRTIPSDFIAAPIQLPPLPEQKRIVEIINTIDKVISQTELTTSKAKNLRSGLLSDLLSGEHEIPASYDKVIGAA